MRNLFRLFKVSSILFKHDLDQFLWQQESLKRYHWLKRLMPWRWFKTEKQPSGQDLRKALVELGPLFVKFGQLLSTRRDLLPEDIADELALLQDKVPPFDGDYAVKLIEKRFKKSITDVFDDFELTPLAAASIAQVHVGRLKTGEEVAIKILRPNIACDVKKDVALLVLLGNLLNRIAKFKRFKPNEVVKEFQNTLTQELDLLREAANASQLRRNFADSELLYVPKVYWDYCHTDILVTERIRGIPIANVQALLDAGVNMKKLAQNGVTIFFTQVFRDCFFHADMHAGNIFVDATRPNEPKYIAVDFGIMGTLSPEDQKYLASNFLAFFKRDYRKVAELHIESGWIPSYVRVDEFEANIRTICEPIFEKPLGEISYGKSLLKLFQTARQFDMELQPKLMLLQKTFLSIEGLGKQLYPELDLWQTGTPFFEQWMKAHMGPRAIAKNLRAKLPFLLHKLPQVPEALYDAMKYWQKQGQLLNKPKKKVQSSNVASLTLILGILLGVCALSFVFSIPTMQTLLQEKSLLLGTIAGTLSLLCLAKAVKALK